MINEEKTGIITLPNVLIKPWFMIGKMSLRKEMQWYKLTNPSAPWICMIIISENGRREDFHRRSRNCSSSMTGFCLFSTFFKLGYCSHLLLVRKAIRARLLFFPHSFNWVPEEENQAWLVSLKKRSENGQKDEGSSVTIKAMFLWSQKGACRQHILWKCISARMCAISP